MPANHVDYNALDKAKNAFIEASKKTMRFAEKFGVIPEGRFGASANIFELDLKPFIKAGADRLSITLLPEGLGTADDARPLDLTSKELERFWLNIGLKTVGVLTNDAAASGLQTILISLYLPSSNPELVFNEQFMKGFLDGFVKGCRQVGCVYFSGETPQLKNKIMSGKIDIAGALFGLTPPGCMPVSSSALGEGDRIVFIESSGPHENGYTTLRALAEKLPSGYRTKLPSGKEYWEALNVPSILYTPFVQALLAASVQPTNIEPITGHGWQKLMRPQKPLRYVIETMLPVPEIFSFVEAQTKMSSEEMIKIFNYGVGLAIFVKTSEDARRAVEIAQQFSLRACHAGFVEQGSKREIVVKPLGVALGDSEFLLSK